jgi:hypothetical protein
MYTLRTFTDTSEVNINLGDYYEIVRREEAPASFAVLFEDHFEKKHVADLDPTSSEETRLCYAIIQTQRDTVPLYKGQKNYIVTETGKTFSNLSYK